MPKRGRKRKKTRTHNPALDAENSTTATSADGTTTKIPKSLVIRRGKCETIVGDLVHDIRKIMMPYTALNFKEDATYRKLTLSKYCQHVCLPLGVSHILAITQNESRLSLKIAKLPQGPTLTFRIHRFSLMKHVQKLQRRPMNVNSLSITSNPPIVVTNNFGDVNSPPQIKLMRITFQNMFPAINVASVQLKECRRVVLFHLLESESGDSDDGSAEQPSSKKTQRIEVRHYAIRATPVGINRKVRRLIQTKIPNLHKVQDIADYISGTTANNDPGSDSEPEDGHNSVVELAQNYTGRGNTKNNKSALKLVELGPRLCLELIKVEQGLGGEGTNSHVMYHAHVTKSKEEIEQIETKKQKEEQLKQQRKKQQELNVERKRKIKEEKRLAKKARKEAKEQAELDELRQNNNNAAHTMDDDDDDDSDSDDDSSSSDDGKDGGNVQQNNNEGESEEDSDDDDDEED